MGRKVKPVRFFPAAALAAFLTAVVISFLAAGCGDIAMRFLIDDLTTKDPEWQLPKKINAEGDTAAGADFGNAVAVSNNYAIVGAKQESSYAGAVYIFYWNGTSWEKQARLTPADATANHYFGTSVAISENYTVIGAPGHTAFQGRIYIYERSGSSWTPYTSNPLFPGSIFGMDMFGFSVALSGNYLIASSPYHDGAGSDRGAAFIFYRDAGGTWSEQDMLQADDAADNDYFGQSVDIDGSRSVIGAVGDDSSQGSGYIFERSGTVWSEKTKLTASNGSPGHEFGGSVGISGGTVVVGAKEADTVYVYELLNAVWNETGILASKITSAGDHFGCSVSVSGDIIMAGANQSGSVTNPGYISFLSKSSGSWSEDRYFLDDNLPNDADFGDSVAVNGNLAIAGAPKDDIPGYDEAGSTFTYERK